MKDKLELLASDHIFDRSDMKEAVYLKLKQMIMKRDFTPNERIDPVEIAEKLGTSRTPVRDALNMLDAEGFVTTMPRQGIYVKGIYKNDLIELFHYREMIELFAVEVGFNNLQLVVNEVVQVVNNFEKLLSSTNYDGNRVMEEDIKLHKLIVQSTINQKIITSYDKLNCHVQMARAYYIQDLHRMNNTHPEHKNFLEALLEGDKEKTKLRLKQHLDHTLENLLKMIDIYKVF